MQKISSHIEGMFEARSGICLFEQWWFPMEEMKAIVIISHGLAEHSGRYAHVAQYFCERGYAVGTYDQYGHGKSEGKRSFISSFEQLLDDFEKFLQQARQKANGKPIFLLGHSLGSGLVVRYAIDRDLAGVRGALLSGSMIVIGSSVPPVLVKIAKVLGTLTPKLPVMKIDHSTISRDPAVMECYDTDPLNYRGKIHARTGSEINLTLNYIQIHMNRITLPMLIVQGSQDRLVDPAGSRFLYEKAASKDKTLKMYEGLYHEILNEPEKEQVMEDMIAWMDARLA